MKPLSMNRAATVLTALVLPALAFSTEALAQSAVQSATSTAPTAMAPKTPAPMNNMAPGSMTPGSTAQGEIAPKVTPAASSAAPSISAAMSAKVEAHIAQLRTELQITPAEEPQWDAFAQVMRDNAAQMDQAFQARGAEMPSMNAVEDLQSYSQIAQVQAANMQKLATAFQALYTTFPVSQQKMADAVFHAKAIHDKKAPMKATTP